MRCCFVALFVALFVNLLFEPWRCQRQRWPRGVFPVEVCRVTSSCRAILSSYCRVTVELRSTCGRVTVELLSSFSSSCPVEARGTRVFQVREQSRQSMRQRAERCVIESYRVLYTTHSLVVRFGSFAVPAVCARSSAPFVDGFYHSWSSRGSAHTCGDILCIL